MKFWMKLWWCWTDKKWQFGEGICSVHNDAHRLLSRMLEHLMSRWRKFRLWQKARPSSSCFMKDAMWRSPNDTSPDSSKPIRSWSMYSNTK